MSNKQRATKEIELRPDAWERFERAVDVVAKSPPQHRIRSDKPKSAAKPRGSSSKPKSV
jgi:hypothetical protein